ncbi:MAG: hypothetical protein HY720_31845 [Planctomycetes bacterium]|nr:hypothetical protein [Planctomycetota bacterium]
MSDRTKSRARRRGGSWGALGALRERVLPRFFSRAALRVYCSLAFACGSAVAGAMLWEHVTAMPRFQIDIGELRIVDRPDWMPERVATEIRVPAAMAGTYSIFDPELVPRVGAGFVANPWVREVREVRRVYPDSIHVSLDLCRPVAWVVRGEQQYLVDGEGVCLPAWGAVGSDLGFPLPAIRGAVRPPPSPGARWSDQGVREGARVGEIVLGSSTLASLDIVAIDVSNVGGRKDPKVGEITLLTRRGTRIVWGRTDLSGRLKLSTERRLEILESHLEAGLLSAHPGLAGIAEIEVSYGQPIVRR